MNKENITSGGKNEHTSKVYKSKRTRMTNENTNSDISLVPADDFRKCE